MRCEKCGEFTPDAKGKKYCSARCRNAVNRKKNWVPVYVGCQVCGSQFTRKAGGQKYCSPECRISVEEMRNIDPDFAPESYHVNRVVRMAW